MYLYMYMYIKYYKLYVYKVLSYGLSAGGFRGSR